MQKIDEENLNLKMEVILNPENQNVIIPAKEVEKSNDISDLKSKLNSLFESYHDCISRSQSINKDKEKRKEIETKILNYMNELDIDSIILSSKYMLKKSKKPLQKKKIKQVDIMNCLEKIYGKDERILIEKFFNEYLKKKLESKHILRIYHKNTKKNKKSLDLNVNI